CPNDSILLECTGSSVIDWFGPSGFISDSTNSIYTSIPGNYFCIQTVDSGCVLLSNTVTLSQNSSPSLLAFPPVFCVSDSTTLSVLASPGSVINWLPPLLGSAPTQVVSTAGTYSCDVVSCGDTSTLSVTVSTFTPVSTPAISFIAPDLVSTPASGYQWYLNGFPIPSANAQNLTPVQQGTYTVQVTDSNGCTAISDPFVFTSLNENSIQNYLHIVPNPASTFIQLTISNAEFKVKDASIIIRNIQGQILLNEPMATDLKIDIVEISNGIYFLEVVSKNIVYKKKFVILK
nr:T9SS type A sorting domain-containing protein [Bacteroidia bacterium]